MSAPQLTLSEQKASVSGKKKKKQTLKNVLNIPNNLEVQSYFLEVSESKKLKKILERLLPTARLPVEKNVQGNTDSNAIQKMEAKKRRDQLILGVNALTRSIKKKLVAAVLLASDIQPKFLVHHLILLCNYNKISLLHLDELRKITKNSLGFPCIALGFKKDFSDFSEAVKEIQAALQNKSQSSNEENRNVSAFDVSESSDEEKNDDLAKNNESQFTYLYRTSNNERIFIPEKIFNDQLQKKPEDYIKVKKSDDEIKFKNKSSNFGISSRFNIQKRKFKTLDNLESPEADEDLEMPKKKAKKDWVIDKTGTKLNIKYFSTNLLKISSNPDRVKKKKK